MRDSLTEAEKAESFATAMQEFMRFRELRKSDPVAYERENARVRKQVDDLLKGFNEPQVGDCPSIKITLPESMRGPIDI